MNEEIRQSQQENHSQDISEKYFRIEEKYFRIEENCTIIYTKENPERIRFKNRSIEEAIFNTFTGDSYQ